MNYCGLLLAATLLSGCRQETVTALHPLPPERVVATVYQVNTHSTANCWGKPDPRSAITTTLKNQQVVELVNVKEGTLHRKHRYWLHVHPHLNPRKSCYMDVTDLIPLT